MKIIFAGTPEFAAIYLKALIDDGSHEICAVYTQPDKPAGRGKQLTESLVKQLALTHHLPVVQPKTLRTPEAQTELAAFNADLMIVVAYGLILPQAVLDTPRLGCINVHGSLLPRWRGAAPIQHAILAGDSETGITIMQMNAGLDTGDMLYKITTPISKTDTTSSLHDRLAELGGKILLESLVLLEKGELKPEKQDDSLACYAHKIEKAHANIDWNKSATEIERSIRAYHTWPVAFSHYEKQTIRIWQSSVINSSSPIAPGTILKVSNEGIEVACGQEALRLEVIQLPGGKPMPVSTLLRGHPHLFKIGHFFSYEA